MKQDGTRNPDGGAPDERRALAGLLYEELRRLAYREMAGEPDGMTLQPTALVHEVYLRLSREPTKSWASRAQFFGAAATAMRRILVEEARKRSALRHGGAFRRTPLDGDPGEDEVAAGLGGEGGDLLALDAALDQLERVDRRMFQVVQLRYFAGLGVDETARVLDVSPRTVRREWGTARLWLYRRISVTRGDGEGHEAPREEESDGP